MPVSPELWFAFALAAAAVIAIPGPTTLMVLGHTVSNGWRMGALSLIGVTLGDICAITLSVLGFSALLATSAEAFTAMKWLGAAYLVWLGIKLWRAGGALDAKPRTDATSALKMLGHAWLVTALNPKGLTFFIAFLPQFIDP